MRKVMRTAGAAIIALTAHALGSNASLADDSALNELVTLKAHIAFLDMAVPGMIVGVVRGDESVVMGFGERASGSGAPDGDTIIRIGSISKALAGQVFTTLVADGSVKLTDRLQDRLNWSIDVPSKDGRAITLLDLATHGSGLPREVGLPRDPAQPELVSRDMYRDALKQQKLLFAPGTGLHYSNYGFDLLGEAMANASGKTYAETLKERVLDPIGMTSTYVRLTDAHKLNAFQGHGTDGRAVELMEVSDMQAAASGVYSTANDMLRWLKWHLDSGSLDQADVRALNHGVYVQRDGRDPVSGLSESARMDAMGLGWVVMYAQENRPTIFQKSGGRQGTLSYIAFSPERGVGVFISINKFDFRAGHYIATFANDLIGELAPR